MTQINYLELYSQEVDLFNNIAQRYETIKENDIMGAYQLMKDSLQAFNRWSVIRHDIRQVSGKGKNAEVKDRLKEICEYLDEVHVDARMIWNAAKDDFKFKREDR